jgi:thiosulfate dehydrogenase
MAGGRALETPFGTIYSTNITPDPQHGIGGWSYAAFDRAMRHGVAADGHRLYPAMPYPSYAKMNDEDMAALWAYLRQGVPAVAQANKPLGMHFPFDQRWGLAYWDAVFADKTPSCPTRRRTPSGTAAPTWCRAWATAAPATRRAASASRNWP